MPLAWEQQQKTEQELTVTGLSEEQVEPRACILNLVSFYVIIHFYRK